MQTSAPGRPRPATQARLRRTRLGVDLTRFRASRWALPVAVGGPTLVGVVAGVLEPRGALTTTQAVVTLVACFAVGLVGGLAIRSRLAVLAAPIVLATAFELTRAPVDGPTVDGIHLGSTYGVVAFVVGRGFDAVLMLMPAVIGALHGRWIAERLLQMPRPRGR